MADKTLDAKRAPSVLKRFAADRAYWTVIEVSSEVLAAAEALSGAHLLCALDSIHAASAKLFSVTSHFAACASDSLIKQVRRRDHRYGLSVSCQSARTLALA